VEDVPEVRSIIRSAFGCELSTFSNERQATRIERIDLEPSDEWLESLEASAAINNMEGPWDSAMGTGTTHRDSNIRASAMESFNEIMEMCMGKPSLGLQFSAELQSIHSWFMGPEPTVPAMARQADQGRMVSLPSTDKSRLHHRLRPANEGGKKGPTSGRV
jgi:hypothetical protein